MGDVPGCCERGHDLIANLNRLDSGTNLDNGAGELMAHNEASARSLVSAVDVQFTAQLVRSLMV